MSCISFHIFDGTYFGMWCGAYNDEIGFDWIWGLPFQHVRNVFVRAIFCLLINSSFFVRVSSMADIPAPKRARRAISIVCKAFGKGFATSHAFDKHWTSEYLRRTPCYTADDGSTRIQKVATDRLTMSTAMLQTLKLDRRTHCTCGEENTSLLILLSL